MTRHRNPFLVFTAMLIMAVLFGGITRTTMAQNVPPSATELITLPIVATDEAGGPIYGILITPDQGEPTAVPTALPTAASTPLPPAPTSSLDPATNPFVYLAFIGLIVVLVAVLFNIPVILRIVAPLIPADMALKIAKEMTPKVADTVLNEVASKTPTVLDDAFAIAALRQNGYIVTGGPGTYHTAPAPEAPVPTSPSTPYPPLKGTPLGTDLTTSKTDTLPTRPASDGGALLPGSGPFPPAQG
jgi:hypothetical protein